MPGLLEDIAKRQRWLAQEMPRIRAEVERAVREEMTLELGLDAIIAASVAEPYDRSQGRTIGLKIPSELRARLEAQIARGADSYTHIVIAAIRIGVAAMEQTPVPEEPEVHAGVADARGGALDGTFVLPPPRSRSPRRVEELEPVPEPVHDERSDDSTSEASGDPDLD